MVNSPDLSIIILNYNGRFWLKQTLESLRHAYLDTTKLQVKVIVVDNNSSDDSIKMVRQSFRWVEVIALSENKGFAGGNNVALAAVKSKYVMLLNSDTEITAESNFDQLVAVMDENKTVGICTPKVTLSDGNIDPACHRGEPTLWASISYFFGLEDLFPSSKTFARYHQYYKDLNTIHEVDACSGAALIARTSAVKKVGLLDEQFFMYGEDLDWCKRFREAGFKILYYPLVIVTHHKYKSGIQSQKGSVSAKTKHYFYDTMLQYFDKHYAHQYPKWVRFFLHNIIQIKKGVS